MELECACEVMERCGLAVEGVKKKRQEESENRLTDADISTSP
jgi:hypothetical protein